MKTVIFLALFLFQFASIANAEDFGRISCYSTGWEVLGDDFKFQLRAAKYLVDEDGSASLLEVKFYTTFGDRDFAVGDVDLVNSDRNYNPRRFRNHVRFDLEQFDSLQLIINKEPTFTEGEFGNTIRTFSANLRIEPNDQYGANIPLVCR